MPKVGARRQLLIAASEERFCLVSLFGSRSLVVSLFCGVVCRSSTMSVFADGGEAAQGAYEDVRSDESETAW